MRISHTFAIIVIVFSLLNPANSAPTTLRNSQGRPIQIGDWSEPKNITVAASGGARILVLRSCQAIIGSTRVGGDTSPQDNPDDIQQIDFLADPTTGDYWIGRRFPKYVFFANRIIGIRAELSMHLKVGFHSEKGLDESEELSLKLQNSLIVHLLQMRNSR